MSSSGRLTTLEFASRKFPFKAAAKKGDDLVMSSLGKYHVLEAPWLPTTTAVGSDVRLYKGQLGACPTFS